jgi:hypothetical protein
VLTDINTYDIMNADVHCDHEDAVKSFSEETAVAEA